MKQTTIRLSRIKISEQMKATMPRAGKMQAKYAYYKKHYELQSTIVLDKHHVLEDGYTSYLIAKMFGIKKVDIFIN